MPDTVIETRDLVYSVEEAGHTRKILDGVNLTIHQGERVALVGASGSGKSTLLNLLGGIDRPAAGEILLQGRSLTDMGEPALTLFRRKHIGFIYQLFNLIPTLTVAENIGLPLELAGVRRAAREERVQHWLQRTGLEGRGTAFPDRLSGGEQQRVAIARALIHEPALVLADEPTGSLDAGTGEAILDLLINVSAQARQTLLIVTHSKRVARRTTRLLLMESGHVREELPERPGGVAW